mmetsp:Transcript_4101/g.8323  ORF Transcript_4101/g.8323 Transcript_4101/m.8323 type:complete len:375 (-) Transcript_4101:90-1214(-)
MKSDYMTTNPKKNCSPKVSFVATLAALSVLGVIAALYTLEPNYTAYNASEEDKKIFDSWMTQHGISYPSQHEYKHRFNVFRDNLAFIRKENQKGHKYTYGMTRFADLRHEEFFRLMTSHINTNFYDGIQVANQLDSSIPESVDWRASSVTPVKDQGNCGSSWAFSAVASLEGFNQIMTGDLLNFSEQELVDCSSNYDSLGCDGGWPSLALLYVRDNGGINLSAGYPYKAEEGTCHRKSPNQESQADAKGSTSKDVTFSKVPVPLRKVYKTRFNSAAAIKTYAARVPLSAAVDASTWQFYTGGVLSDLDCGRSVNHAVTIVGYTQSEWIIKNSWGTGWGEEGYIRLDMTSTHTGPCGLYLNGGMFPASGASDMQA